MARAAGSGGPQLGLNRWVPEALAAAGRARPRLRRGLSNVLGTGATRARPRRRRAQRGRGMTSSPSLLPGWAQPRARRPTTTSPGARQAPPFGLDEHAAGPDRRRQRSTASRDPTTPTAQCRRRCARRPRPPRPDRAGTRVPLPGWRSPSGTTQDGSAVPARQGGPSGWAASASPPPRNGSLPPTSSSPRSPGGRRATPTPEIAGLLQAAGMVADAVAHRAGIARRRARRQPDLA